MNSEVIIGLADIKRWNIFDRLPHLVRAESLHDEGSDNESNENKSGPDTRVHTETRICEIYGSEWIDEDPYYEDEETDFLEADCDGEILLASMMTTIDDISNEIEGISLRRKVYERDDISEMDLDRFEAIPVEALKDLPPSLPTKILVQRN